MRKQLVDLVESVRDLGLGRVPTEVNPSGISLRGSKAEFAQKLGRVHDALAALDQAGAKSASLTPDDAAGPAQAVDPSMDVMLLRMALDGVFRWMRSQGIDITEPHAVVAQVLKGPTPASGGARYRPTPGYVIKPAAGGKPGVMTKLTPELHERASLSSLAGREYRAQQVDTLLGAAAPRR